MMERLPLPAEDEQRQRMRNAVSYLLHKQLPPDDALTVAAWNACVHWSDELSELVRILGSSGAGVIVSRCDRWHLVARALASAVTLASHWDTHFQPRGIAFLPCPGLATYVEAARVDAFLSGGGIVVTSDRSLEHEPMRSLLPMAGRGGPRRARVTLDTCSPFAPLLPAVHVPAGGYRLDPAVAGRTGVRVLAKDVLTEEPLVVLASVGEGFLLHSVAHWFQQDEGWFTAVERTPAGCTSSDDARCCAAEGLLLGDLQAAFAMSHVLCRGLSIARSDRNPSHGAPIDGGERIAADA